jgi:hypothetical protein
MTSVESYKHRFAKGTLVRWLREVAAEAGHYGDAKLFPIHWEVNRAGPHFGVWPEWPICLDDKNEVWGDNAWDEQGWPERPPTYDEAVAAGLLPILIFDVAIHESGFLTKAVEVVHRHGVSETKLAYLKRINIEVWAIDADWILSQVRRPGKLKCDLVARPETRIPEATKARSNARNAAACDNAPRVVPYGAMKVKQSDDGTWQVVAEDGRVVAAGLSNAAAWASADRRDSKAVRDLDRHRRISRTLAGTG